MKLFRIPVIAILAIGMVACGGSREDELTDALNELEETFENLDEEMSSSDDEWSTVEGDGFEIDIPGHMEEMYDLNAEAALQYGYVEQVGYEVQEHYLIVLMETKEEIASYELDMEFDAMSYRDISVESLRDGLDAYTVLTEDPVVETVNGMDCVKNEMRGALGEVNVYYQLGVFEGENAFYQVLTWTVEEQKSNFKSDMEASIDSFSEL
ncbi:MAG: hypothetical protein MK078_15795 [Crocinitomicaceae bacterium]|nr:hypothetical protein [Crocinitomicaceae bacterium]